MEIYTCFHSFAGKNDFKIVLLSKMNQGNSSEIALRLYKLVYYMLDY